MTETILFVMMILNGAWTAMPPVVFPSANTCEVMRVATIAMRDHKLFKEYDGVAAICITPEYEAKGQDT